MRWKKPASPSSNPAQQWLPALAFASAILIGTLLLLLPAARQPGQTAHLTTAIFLATSAVCVTGLSPVEITQYLSPFGQGILLLLVQLGGLGIMTLGTFLFEMLGRRLSLSNEQLLASSLGSSTTGRLYSLLGRTLVFTIVWELGGTLLLAWRYHGTWGYPAGQALRHGLFHSISAFCNAGFSLYPTSLAGFAGDPWYLLIIATLVISGGLGFIVHTNLAGLAPWRRNRLSRGHLSLHSRIVLLGTVVLLLGGTLTIFLLERHGTLAGRPLPLQWVSAFFECATWRTAGFSTVETGALQGLSKALAMFLMFVGGAPGSTAGGIKVTTLVVLAATVSAITRNHDEVEFAQRTIPARAVRESIVIALLGLLSVAVASLTLHLTEAAAFAPRNGLSLPLLFETVSAVGTVGLSHDVVPQLSAAGRLLLCLCMFVGRLGPLTLALNISGAAPSPARRFPEENVIVG